MTLYLSSHILCKWRREDKYFFERTIQENLYPNAFKSVSYFGKICLPILCNFSKTVYRLKDSINKCHQQRETISSRLVHCTLLGIRDSNRRRKGINLAVDQSPNVQRSFSIRALRVNTKFNQLQDSFIKAKLKLSTSFWFKYFT